MGREIFQQRSHLDAASLISNDMRISVYLYEGKCEKHDGAINPKTINQVTTLKFAVPPAKPPHTRKQNSI